MTAGGNERRPIYRDVTDRRHFCQLLAETVERFAWGIQAYVLMENHYHLNRDLVSRHYVHLL